MHKLSQELGAQLPISELVTGLSNKERVKYRSNGNRAVNANTFLKKIQKVAPLIGVTRTADISFLSPSKYPVFQTCRPQIFLHSKLGQNTGAQGKGSHVTQAKISALMETIESYCSEPRNVQLIRASFNFLKDQHVVANPNSWIKVFNPDPFDLDTNIMWTKAYCLELQQEVLIPAETVYFPFMARSYETPSVFPSGSNGLASGSTYLEAVIHAIYELIERYYSSFLDGDPSKINIEALFEEELDHKGIRDFEKTSQGEYELQIYTMELVGKKNLPMILCSLVGDKTHYMGAGCSGTVDISIDRAISEAFQSLSTIISGSREDIEGEIKSTKSLFEKVPQPEKRTMRVSQYRKKVFDKTFNSLNEEYNFIMKFLKDLGFHRTYVVNLSRKGIDIPVVKVIVEGMECEADAKSRAICTHGELMKNFYPNISNQKINQ